MFTQHRICFNIRYVSVVAMNLKLDPNQLKQLPTEELVGLLVKQQLVIEKLQQEIYRLKASQKLDSQASSKPPSTDLLLKPEKPKKPRDKSAGDKNNSDEENRAGAKSDKPKRKPGGQPGHPGKTRKGFGRVDRYSILKPQKCQSCGCVEFEENPASVQRQQVAQLVAHPIEVVEYQR